MAEAAAYLEHPSFLIRLANLVGKPAEAVLKALPAKAHSVVMQATSSALETALSWALRSLPTDPGAVASAASPDAAEKPASRFSLSPGLHTAVAATTGAVGGLFGLSGMFVEVPTTTTVMLRSIAATAARGGADLNDPATRLECLTVLSLAPRLPMKWNRLISLAAWAWRWPWRVGPVRHPAHCRGSGRCAARAPPALLRLMGQIASRFEVVLTEKLAAQMVPIAGAVSGALINAAFTDHFNTVARYHFGILRLERLHGKAAIEAAYKERRLEDLRH